MDPFVVLVMSVREVRAARVGADCSEPLIDMDPWTKVLLKPAYVDTADEVYFTYSITNESSPVCSSSSTTSPASSS